ATPAGISPEDGGTEAMITPDGRIEHAAGGGRERAVQAILRDAVRRSETARGRLRRADPDEALGLWQGLVDGTWSLVDHTESISPSCIGTTSKRAYRSDPFPKSS
ncbi:MAG TPA: hypothetical protein VIV60_36875, partial [Polyangiaceae bacterium]